MPECVLARPRILPALDAPTRRLPPHAECLPVCVCASWTVTGAWASGSRWAWPRGQASLSEVPHDDTDDTDAVTAEDAEGRFAVGMPRAHLP